MGRDPVEHAKRAKHKTTRYMESNLLSVQKFIEYYRDLCSGSLGFRSYGKINDEMAKKLACFRWLFCFCSKVFDRQFFYVQGVPKMEDHKKSFC